MNTIVGLLQQLRDADQEFWSGFPCSDISLVKRALRAEIDRLKELNRLLQLRYEWVSSKVQSDYANRVYKSSMSIEIDD